MNWTADLAVDEAGRLARARSADLLVLLVRPEGDLRAVVDPSLAAEPLNIEAYEEGEDTGEGE